MLDPELVEGVDHHIGFDFTGEDSLGIHVRNGVAVPTDGAGATDRISLPFALWAKVLAGAVGLSAAIEAGDITVSGSSSRVLTTLAAFENQGLRN